MSATCKGRRLSHNGALLHFVKLDLPCFRNVTRVVHDFNRTTYVVWLLTEDGVEYELWVRHGFELVLLDVEAMFDESAFRPSDDKTKLWRSS